MNKIGLFWLMAALLLVSGLFYFINRPVIIPSKELTPTLPRQQAPEPALETADNSELKTSESEEEDISPEEGEQYNNNEGIGFFRKKLAGLQKKFDDKKITSDRFHSDRCAILLRLKEKYPQFSEGRKKAFSLALEDFNHLDEYWDQRAAGSNDMHKTFVEKSGFIKKGSVVADIGCGVGNYLFFFADRVGENGKVYGVDIDPYCIDFLKKVKKKREFKNITLVKSVPDDVMLPRNSVDFAYLKGVAPYCLGEMHDKPMATGFFTRSIHRALKKKGILYISNDAETEEYADRNLPRLIDLVKKNGPFKLKYEFQKLNSYVLVFEKI